EQDRISESEELCTKILQSFPCHPRCLHLRGVINLQKENISDSIFDLKNAIKMAPSPVAHFHASLGYAYSTQADKSSSAIQEMRRAIELAPQEIRYYEACARFLKASKDFKAACDLLEIAVSFDPTNSELHYKYAKYLRNKGDKDKAAEHFRKCLELQPDHSLAEFWLGTFGGSDAVPSKCPENYIKKLYNGYASKFEEHLVKDLRYQTPTVINALLQQVTEERGWNSTNNAALDLGCGTGLSGLAFKVHARSMVGVDLSEAMIEEARKKDIYNEVHVADVLGFLREKLIQSENYNPPGEDGHSQPIHQFDLFIACDVFVYIGDLSEVMQTISLLVKNTTLPRGDDSDQPSAIIVFSTEKQLSGDTPFTLNDTGRYTHSKQYILDICRQNDLEVCKIEERTIRQNKGLPVLGFLVVCSIVV
ncbi:unnamed protein product, partial [Heterosigma akashiwo]